MPWAHLPMKPWVSTAQDSSLQSGQTFFPLCKSQSRKELFICQRLHKGKEKFRHRQARSRHELPLHPGLGAGPAWAPTSHLRPVGKATETSSDREQFGEGWSTFPLPVCLLPGCSLAWMKNKPMSCHPQSSSLAPSCRWAGISVGQGSQAGALPPQPSAHTNPWGPL